MTVNELIKELEQWSNEGAGNTDVTVMPLSKKYDALAALGIHCVSFNGKHNGKFLNIQIYTKD
jgi:hypothetical protein